MKIQRNQPNTQKPHLPRLCIADVGLMAAITVIMTAVLATSHLVPMTYLLLMVAVYLGITVGVFFLVRNRQRRKLQIAGTLLTAIMLVASLIAGYYITRTINTVQKVVDASVERSTVSFYSLQSNPAESLEEMSDSAFGILKALDRDNTEQTLQQVEAEHNLTLTTVEFDDLMSLADALLDGSVDGIVLNEAYLTLYEETAGYENFPSQLKTISTRQVEHVVEPEPEEAESDDPIINILISGSDTRNDVIDQRGRSDVNIIASINTETHQILLISTPRDYFVPLDVGVEDAYDKLTHAGIYGMDVLKGTLENLYGINIDYYFRINFTGFVDVIDALGGIDVYSDYEFDSRGSHFDQGWNQLTGEEALNFARERYSFAEGDRQRGDNQLEIVKAVLNKAVSPTILTKYLTILDNIQNCIDTSIPYDVLANLVRKQLEDNASWSIESFSVNGSDARSTTYSMNQQLYVMIPDEATVQEAKEKLTAIGNELQQEESEEESPDSTAEPAA